MFRTRYRLKAHILLSKYKPLEYPALRTALPCPLLASHASGEGPISLQDEPNASKYQKNSVFPKLITLGIDSGAKTLDIWIYI